MRKTWEGGRGRSNPQREVSEEKEYEEERVREGEG